jgi:hypothetical protein
VALFWGFIDGETITVTGFVSLAIILFGVFLANRPEKKESRATAPLADINIEKAG